MAKTWKKIGIAAVALLGLAMFFALGLSVEAAPIISSYWRVYRKDSAGVLQPTIIASSTCASACDYTPNLPGGKYAAFLTVTDGGGQSDTTRADFDITPLPSIECDPATCRIYEGEGIRFFNRTP